MFNFRRGMGLFGYDVFLWLILVVNYFFLVWVWLIFILWNEDYLKKKFNYDMYFFFMIWLWCIVIEWFMYIYIWFVNKFFFDILLDCIFEYFLWFFEYFLWKNICIRGFFGMICWKCLMREIYKYIFFWWLKG